MKDESRMLLRWVGEFIQVEMEDNGKGISQENLRSIFDRFYRTDASRNSSTGGHGLGLAIARAVAAAHKGEITASSPEENTMRFEVFLPQ